MAEFSIGRLLRRVRAGEAKLAWNRPGLSAPETLTLRSGAFADGGRMPRRTAGKGVGENVSPPLSWDGVPTDAVELVLLVEDPDAPVPSPIFHLAIAGIPASESSIHEGGLNAGAHPYGQGTGTLGRRGYSGPRPVRGHGPHEYVFQLYALSEPLELPLGASPTRIVDAMAGKVVARGRLVGLYER